jgi:hypothetical protein
MLLFVLFTKFSRLSGDVVEANDLFFINGEFKFVGDKFPFEDFVFELNIVVVILKDEPLLEVLLIDFSILRLLNKLI